jgi:peptidoglycan-associated lipoprotein
MRKQHLKLLVMLSILGFVVVLGGCHKKEVPPPPPPPPAAAPPPAPIINLTAEPATVEKGQSVTLSWNSENATSVSVSPDVGTVEASGSTSVTPGQSTTYVATATGPGGSSTASARVTVSVPPPPPPPATKPRVSEESIFNNQIQDVYFDFDRSDIRPDAQSALTADAEVLKSYPDIVFTIEGHCDERGSEEYNLGLGDRRATAAKNFLVNLGISASRISTISYGKDRPFCTESTEGCWQSNRRGHMVFGRPGSR